jgi:hypothetical protein
LLNFCVQHYDNIVVGRTRRSGSKKKLRNAKE